MKALQWIITVCYTANVCYGLKVLHFQTDHPFYTRRYDASLQRRAKTVSGDVDLSNQGVDYTLNLTIGTPGQNIGVQLDTGSSDTWVPLKDSEVCGGSSCNSSVFNPNASTTLQEINRVYSISYGDGTEVQGNFASDTISIGGANLSNVPFVIANKVSTQDSNMQGILGLGYELNEVATENGTVYPNFLTYLVSQGHINTRAFSVWLNDPSSAKGNVLFGGVDSGKYSGPLFTMPVLLDDSGNHSEFNVPLTGVSFSAGDQNFTYTSQDFTEPALLDVGTTEIYLPDDIIKGIWSSLNVNVSQEELPILPCSIGDDASAKLTFTLNGQSNGPKIDVPLRDLLYPNGDGTCVLLVSNGGPSGFAILGLAFLQSVYAVFDLTHNTIALAQSSFNSSVSNIQVIDGPTLPNAVAVSSPITSIPSSIATAVSPETSLSVPTFSFNTTIATTSMSSSSSTATSTSSSSTKSSAPSSSSTTSESGLTMRPAWSAIFLAILLKVMDL